MEFQKKILTVVGTRPNFIKITQLDKELEKYGRYFKHILVHTGQHFDKNMSDIFFEQFRLRTPDYTMNVKGQSPAAQIGSIIIELDKILVEEKPDLVIVVGDVNSTMASAIAANKNNIRVAHLESGLRSFDRDMPEEINRLLTDQIADLFFVTEQSGYDHLINEHVPVSKIFFVGNTMIDTLVAFEREVLASDIIEKLAIQHRPFVLMTMHRPSNVDTKERLEILLDIIEHICTNKYLVWPIHPRTLQNLKKFDLSERFEKIDNIILTDPLDYFAFQHLISKASFIVTDSGGIQEETTFRQVPCLTLRENTERPVTITLGTNTLVEYSSESVISYISQIENGTYKRGAIPPYWDGRATERIVAIIKDKI
jgi:UDP-N-acetylglucosamine 2-epimerase (non-hydrolysing)